jgi:hypothetical protein
MSQALSLAWSQNHSHTFVLSKLTLPSVHSLLHLLQSVSPDILIYSEDIMGPVSCLKHLSVLVILQSLLNLQAELDYLREHHPSRFCLGQGA